MFHFSSVTKNSNKCYHSSIILHSQNHAADALATQGAKASATTLLTLLSPNKTCKTQTLVHGTCEHLFIYIFLILTLAVLNLFYGIQKYVYPLYHSHHWYCVENLYRLYRKVYTCILVAEDPGTQGARALTARVLTKFSRNLSVSPPEGLTVV